MYYYFWNPMKIRMLLLYCSRALFSFLFVMAAITARGVEPVVIDYMVLYTPAAEELAGGAAAMTNKINAGVTNVNNALAKSGLDYITYRLVHTQKLSGNNTNIDLEAAITEIFQLDPVYDIRDMYRADSVSILVERLNVGAWATIPLSASQAEQSFSYFGVQNYGGITTAHELGHNMGGYHNNPDQETSLYSSSWAPYGYNFIGTNGIHYKTIMSTNVYSPLDPSGTNRLVNCGQYSNPQVNYQGAPSGQAGSADMAATITNWAPLIANTYGDTNAPDPDPDPVIGPIIKANGAANTVTVSQAATVTLSVEMNPGQYAGTNADWWAVAFARSGAWYYLDSAMEWKAFDGNLASCRPVNQGALFNLPSTTILDRLQLPCGIYDCWFAVDYSMDGVLNYPDGQYLTDIVTVVVE